MAKKSPQQFIKRQKEMERAQKAKEKMAKRHHEKKNSGETDDELIGHADDPIT